MKVLCLMEESSNMTSWKMCLRRTICCLSPSVAQVESPGRGHCGDEGTQFPLDNHNPGWRIWTHLLYLCVEDRNLDVKVTEENTDIYTFFNRVSFLWRILEAVELVWCYT